MSRTLFTDKELLEFFKNFQDIINSQKELNHLTDKRLKLLESSQFRQKPLVLTKEMEVKN